MARTIIITGGTGGIGYYSALGIAKAESESTVVITGRNMERGEAAVKKLKEESKNENIELVLGDVSSIAKVDQLAKTIIDKYDCIDVLVNNAAHLGNEYEKNEDGIEMHFAINVVAVYRLVQQLKPKLSRTARIINITGGNPVPSAVDLDNMQAEKGFKTLMTYGHSKSVMEAMTIGLSKELPDGQTANIIYPGFASTSLTQGMTSENLPFFMKFLFPLFKYFTREDDGVSAEKAARSTIWAVTSEDLAKVTGKYFDTNCKEKTLHSTSANPDVQDKIMAAIKQVLPN